MFGLYAKGKEYLEIDGYYIVYGGMVNAPYFQRPKCFFEKEHIKIINSLIEKALENKPIFTLSFPSKKFYLWKQKIRFNFILKKKLQ